MVKFDQNSELWVKKIVEEWRDELGRRNIRTSWFKAEKNLEWGSVKNPKNKEIIALEWRDKSQGDLSQVAKRLFGGS